MPHFPFTCEQSKIFELQPLLSTQPDHTGLHPRLRAKIITSTAKYGQVDVVLVSHFSDVLDKEQQTLVMMAMF